MTGFPCFFPDTHEIISFHVRVPILTRWLPEKVRDVAGGMRSCAALLEPEVTNTQSATGWEGPLSLMLHCPSRIVTFATSPLGMDYMFQKFTRGLPGLMDVAHTRKVESPHYDPREEAKAQESLTALCQGCWVGRTLKGVGMAISGESVCTLTVLPGGHFITTGIVSLPNAYYKVPAVRMVFDLIVFIGSLTLFTKEVLLAKSGPIGEGEIAFAVYIVVSVYPEIQSPFEARSKLHKTNEPVYFFDADTSWRTFATLHAEKANIGTIILRVAYFSSGGSI